MDKYGQQQQSYQSVSTAWITGVNQWFDTLSAENQKLREQLKALTDYLGVKFQDRPAIPAYVAVVERYEDEMTL